MQIFVSPPVVNLCAESISSDCTSEDIQAYVQEAFKEIATVLKSERYAMPVTSSSRPVYVHWRIVKLLTGHPREVTCTQTTAQQY